MPRPIACSVFIATSLDGYIAREDGALDWLPQIAEEHGYDAFMATIDAHVIGRHTFEWVLAYGGPWLYTKPVVVLTSGAPPAELPGEARDLEFMAGDPRAVVARLAERGWTSLYVDGGVTIQRFLEARLITRMILTRVPVVIGRGIPLFGPTARDIVLEHVGTKAFASGLVTSEYRVVRPAEREQDRS